MKNTLALNIGLSRNDGRENSAESIGHALRDRGFIVTASRIVDSEWQGKPETTLACDVLPALPLCHVSCRQAVKIQVERLAEELGQDCIATVWPEGHGELVPAIGEFDPSLFHPVITTEREEAESFITWLQDTLIPDLKESGTVETAKDFETLISYFRKFAK